METKAAASSGRVYRLATSVMSPKFYPCLEKKGRGLALAEASTFMGSHPSAEMICTARN